MCERVRYILWLVEEYGVPTVLFLTHPVFVQADTGLAATLPDIGPCLCYLNHIAADSSYWDLLPLPRAGPSTCQKRLYP